MKKHFLFYLLAFIAMFCIQCSTQKETSNVSVTADQPETEINAFGVFFDQGDKEMVAPSFPGGEEALKDFMNQHISYPAKAIARNSQGYVLAEFNVGKNGQVVNIRILKDIGSGTADQVRKAIELMPAWNPAKKSDKSIESIYHILVDFGMSVPVDYSRLENFLLNFNELIDINQTFDSPKESATYPSWDSAKLYEDAERVEEMPQFPGGEKAFYYYLAGSINYPDEMTNSEIQGRVIVSYIIEANGSISHVKVEESVEKSLDMEAVRIVSQMPRWKPGTVNGSPVRVKYYLPVAFSLQ